MEYETGAPSPDDQAGRDDQDVIGIEPPGRMNRRRRGLAIAAGAVVLVGGGGAAALAATTAPAPKPSTPGQSVNPYGEGPAGELPGGPRGGGRGLFALGGDALHGQLTVRGSGSTYENVLVQRGTVTAVSPTSLNVRSADGYAHTYKLNAATTVDGVNGAVSTLKTGDTVGVLAGNDSTARMVVKAGAAGHRMFPGRPGENGAPPWAGRLPGQGLRGETPAPGQATPGAVPGASVPGASVPGASVPGTSVPGTSGAAAGAASAAGGSTT